MGLNYFELQLSYFGITGGIVLDHEYPPSIFGVLVYWQANCRKCTSAAPVFDAPFRAIELFRGVTYRTPLVTDEDLRR